MLYDDSDDEPPRPLIGQVKAAMPEWFQRPDPDERCGICENLHPQTLRCTLRRLLVTPERPRCEVYIGYDERSYVPLDQRRDGGALEPEVSGPL